MDFIFNELSILNSYNDPDALAKDFKSLIEARASSDFLRTSLKCARDLPDIVVLNNKSLREIVLSDFEVDLKRSIFRWIDRNGPFWCESRTQVGDDLFYYITTDVTNYGLGECARREIDSKKNKSFSISSEEFNKREIPILQGLQEEPIQEINITNIFGFVDILQEAQKHLPKPQNWDDAYRLFCTEFPLVLFSQEIPKQLSSITFSIHLLDTICSKLAVLNNYMASRDNTGLETDQSREILDNYFSGGKPWFTDSSDTEKKRFSSELTFKDLFDGKSKLFPFHGKVNTPAIRFHFEWPVEKSATQIQVVYLGPKLTKK